MVFFMPRYTQTVFPVKKVVGLTTGMAEAISEYRHREHISSENEAIRRLIEAGLQAGDKIPIRKTSAEPTGGSGPNPGGGDKPAPTSKPPRRRPRTPKAAPISKEAQLRALRELVAR